MSLSAPNQNSPFDLPEAPSLDPLTGVLSSSSFAEEIVRSYCAVSPLSRYRPYVMLVELSNHQEIEREFGTDGIAFCLAELAKLLRGVFRAQDHTGRIGEHEFAVLLPALTTELAIKIATKIVELVSNSPANFYGVTIPLIVGIGITNLPAPQDILAPVFENANEALKIAQAEGDYNCACLTLTHSFETSGSTAKLRTASQSDTPKA